MAVTESRQAEGDRVVADDRAHLIHSWSVQSALNPIPVAGGEGRYFWDYNGTRYLDFASSSSTWRSATSTRSSSPRSRSRRVSSARSRPRSQTTSAPSSGGSSPR